MDEQSPLLTPRKAAGLLGISRAAIYAAIKENRLRIVHRQPQIILRKEDVEIYGKTMGIKQCREAYIARMNADPINNENVPEADIELWRVEARRKEGTKIFQDREHMAEMGRKGGRK